MAYDERPTIPREMKIIGGIAAALGLIVLLLVTGTYAVGAGESAVLFDQGNGSVTGPYGPGWHLKVPFVQEAVKYETRAKTWSADASAASRDAQVVHAVVAVSFHPDPQWLAWLHQRWGPDFANRVVIPQALQAIKAATAQHDAVDLIRQREVIRQAVYDAVGPPLLAEHIILDVVSVVNLDYSDEFNAAIEAKVVAQQQAERERNLLEAVEAVANQTVAKARGEAEAVHTLGAALRVNPEVIRWEMVRNWRPLVLGGDATALLPLNLSAPAT